MLCQARRKGADQDWSALQVKRRGPGCWLAPFAVGHVNGRVICSAGANKANPIYDDQSSLAKQKAPTAAMTKSTLRRGCEPSPVVMRSFHSPCAVNCEQRHASRGSAGLVVNGLQQLLPQSVSTLIRGYLKKEESKSESVIIEQV